MKASPASLLFSATGTIDRVRYAVIGVGLFAVKHILDIAIALAFRMNGFIGDLSAFGYWIPLGKPVDIARLSAHDVLFLLALLAIAVPFVWIGVATTLKRLHAVYWPSWLVVLFFVPVVNVVFFALLVAVPDTADFIAARARETQPSAPAKPLTRALDRLMPFGLFANAAMAVVLTAVFGVGAIALGTLVFREYGWGVFVAVPVCQGILAALLLGYREPRSLVQCLGVAELSVVLGGILLLAVAIEGAICIAMAAPLALAFAFIGGLIGYQLQRRTTPAAAPLVVVLLAAPLLMAADLVMPARPPLLVVTTATIVHAAPETVWRNVVSFTDLPAPHETIFKLGVAYPVRARIEGSGRGATRYCEFSTGAFVEPITTWDEPHVLGFDVTRNPEPMRELSPYKNLTTPHLHGYLVAERGEFDLIALPDGDTELIGTTWYRDNVWPNEYWRLWSDPIIHAIHTRVLEHIKHQAESHDSRRIPVR